MLIFVADACRKPQGLRQRTSAKDFGKGLRQRLGQFQQSPQFPFSGLLLFFWGKRKTPPDFRAGFVSGWFPGRVCFWVSGCLGFLGSFGKYEPPPGFSGGGGVGGCGFSGGVCV